MQESTPLIGGAPNLPQKVEDDHEPKVKEINHIGSFTLLINNMVGPAMLGIPRLYQQAGLIPTTICIVFIYLCATLSGTLFSDAISSIPGNKSFDRHVDFSTAFKLIIGFEFYVIAETLFLITCVVQAVAAIVEAAQSVDGFLASFLIGRTYALEVYPSPGLISWTPELCLKDESMVNDEGAPSTEGTDCTPFNGTGSFIITLGFVLTTMLFLPLGRGEFVAPALVFLCDCVCHFKITISDLSSAMLLHTSFVSFHILHRRLPEGDDHRAAAGVHLHVHSAGTVHIRVHAEGLSPGN